MNKEYLVIEKEVLENLDRHYPNCSPDYIGEMLIAKHSKNIAPIISDDNKSWDKIYEEFMASKEFRNISPFLKEKIYNWFKTQPLKIEL